MIVEFFKRGTGVSAGPIDYFLGKERNREHAKILSGDLEEVAELIDSSPYVKKYTAGCLSFYEHDLSDAKKKNLMAAFEKTLFPGLNPDQYRIVWIEHKDKENAETGEKRLELNFLIPNIEITKGKRLQPFYAKADLNRVNDFKSIVNYKYQLFDPDDPINRRSVKIAKNLPKDKKKFISVINTEVALAITEGLVSDRESLKSWMTEIGLEITRITKNQISVKNPNNPDGKPIPLKGEFYEQNFRHSEQSAELKRKASERYRQEANSRYANCIERYKKLCKSKSEYHLERYATGDRTNSAEFTRQPEKQKNEHTNQYKQDGGRLEQRYAGDAREPTDADTEHEKGLADVKRIEPSNNRTGESEKKPFFIEYSPSFDSTYFAYYEHQLRLRQQKQVQRYTSDEKQSQLSEITGRQHDNNDLWGEIVCGARSESLKRQLQLGQWHTTTGHSERGTLNESRSTVIEDHRRTTVAIEATTARTSESTATHSTAVSDYRAVKELHENFKRQAQRSSDDCEGISADRAESIRTDYFSSFFKDFRGQLVRAVTETVQDLSEWFEHQERSTRDTTNLGKTRDQEANDAISAEHRNGIRLSTGVSQKVRGFNLGGLFKALDELDRHRQLKKNDDKDYDTPSPF